MTAYDFLPSKRDQKILTLCGFFIAAFAALIVKEVRIPDFYIATPIFLFAMYFFIQGRAPKPEYCLYALTVYIPFSKQLAFDAGAFPTPFAAALVLSGLMMVSIWMNPEKRAALKLRTPIHLPILGIFIFGTISVINGIFFGHAHAGFAIYEFFRIWIIPVLMFLSIYHSLDSKNTAKNVVWIMMIALLFVSLMTIFEFLSAGDVKLDKSRAGGIANDPNVLAVFLNYLMLVALGFFLTFWKRKGGWVFALPFLAALRALIGTFSRGGYVCFALGFAATCIARRKRLLIPILIGGALLFYFPQVLPHSIRSRMAQTIEKPAAITGEKASVTDALDRSNRDRIEIWKGAIAMIKERPLFGFGYTRFVPTVTDYWIEKMPFEPHNTVLFIAAEMGIPGALAFIWLILVFFWQGLKLRLQPRDEFEMALSVGMIGAMISLLPAHLHVIRLDSLAIAGYFWILIAIVMKFVKTPLPEKTFSKETVPAP